jgi:carboxymethylenebutenolidase
MPPVTDIRVPYFFARPAADPPWPGVVVCLEGFGVDQWLLQVCQRLAAEGFAAMAPDMYYRFGGSDRNAGREHIMKLTKEDSLADVAECVAELRALGASKVGVTGFCMGGRITYQVATKGDADIDAAVGFYGAQIGSMLAEPTCPMFLFFGGDDDYIPPQELKKIEERHAPNVIIYDDAHHGFMHAANDIDAKAAADAWPKLLDFFNTHLR